ncbi:MAG: 30S ribosomal protein S9 [Chloroflexi bacterium]|nr:30S ribosomal protein S9 [Chloroflexota bacterium]
MTTNQTYYYAVGRRKTAIARVKLIPGNGAVVINGKPMGEVFGRLSLENTIMQPFRVSNTLGKFNAIVKVIGGGISAQAGAIAHGVSRALVEADDTLKALLKKQGLMTRDPRVKERKKYGLKRARKAPQYTKR